MPLLSAEIIQGDALTILPTLLDESVDAIVTDPPYNSGGRTFSERTGKSPVQKYQQGGVKVVRPDFDGDNKDQRGYLAWCTLWLAQCWRIARVGAPICVFTDWRQLPITTDALQAGGWIWRGIAPWDKTRSARPQKGRFTAQAEFVVWGSKGPMPLDRGVGVLPGVFTHGVRQGDKFHLTGKPTPLMEEVVRITEPGGTILDPFAGSGTTLVAALRQGYNAVGIEQKAAYAEIARWRIAAERSTDAEHGSAVSEVPE